MKMTMRRRIRKVLTVAKSTSGEIASILGEDMHVVSAQLCQMLSRGEVIGEWFDVNRRLWSITEKGKNIRPYRYKQ